MNKLALSLLLVAMFVGLAAANLIKKGHKHHHKQHHDDDYDHEPEHHNKHGHNWNHDDDDYGHHNHHGHHGHQDWDCSHCGHFDHGHKKHHKLGHLSLARAAGAGVGAIGGAGFRKQKEFDAGVHSHKHLGSHKLAEGEAGFVAGGKKKFRAGKNRHDVHDAEGHNRHSGFNKDKLIVKEHEDGFKGDVGFHNHDEHSDSAHLSGSGSKFVAGKKGGRIVSNKNIDSDFDAGVHAGSDTEAGFGVAKGVGLAEV